jgi:hypothetical protein
MFNSPTDQPHNAEALLTIARRLATQAIQAYPPRNAAPLITAAYLQAVKLSGDVVTELNRRAKAR